MILEFYFLFHFIFVLFLTKVKCKILQFGTVYLKRSSYPLRHERQIGTMFDLIKVILLLLERCPEFGVLLSTL